MVDRIRAAVERGVNAFQRYDWMWSGRINIVRLDIGGGLNRGPLAMLFGTPAHPVAQAQQHLGRPPHGGPARQWDIEHGIYPMSWTDAEVNALTAAWRTAVLEHRTLLVSRWEEEACSFGPDVRGPWVAARAALTRKHGPSVGSPDTHVFLDKMLESGLLDPQMLMDGLWLGQPQVEGWLRERGWKPPTDRNLVADIREMEMSAHHGMDHPVWQRVVTLEVALPAAEVNEPLHVALALAARRVLEKSGPTEGPDRPTVWRGGGPPAAEPRRRAAAVRTKDRVGWQVEVMEVPGEELTLEAMLAWPGSLADLPSRGEP